MIRALDINSSPFVVRSNHDGKSAAETPFDAMVMESVGALCQFCLLVSQQNNPEVSLKILDNALKRFY